MKSSRVPMASLIVLARLGAAAILVARMYARSASGPTLIVKAVAHQWSWKFDYLRGQQFSRESCATGA